MVIDLHKFKIFMCCVYIAPGNEVAYRSFIDKLEENCSNIRDQDIIVLCGDFNCSSLKWASQTSCDVLVATEIESKYAHFVDTLDFLDMKQFNNICNKNEKILDLIFCNKHRVDRISRSDVPLVCEDDHHPAIEFFCNVGARDYLRETSSYNFNFRKGDYDAINSELLGVDWGSLLGGVDVNVGVDVLYKMLEKVISKYVPKTKINRKFFHPRNDTYYSKKT